MEATGVKLKSDVESDVEQYAITEDEEETKEKPYATLDSSKRVSTKRKRSPSQPDEEETGRRRRRRSLVYQARRRSLTPSEKKASAAAQTSGTGTAAPARSKQYISDMYSTIIKMSSENKINVKNSWSLHLIDHMDDILAASKRRAADGEADDDTYNFQKASCTLDASIKIYAYRVDDTWNSSYKILENLSRTEQTQGSEHEDGERKSARRKTSKTHARTIEKHVHHLNLKGYDVECDADPLFHKMSQSFDEGGAKGMLLANLSVYDGCKILLNSSDVSAVTRKPMREVAVESRAKEKKVASGGGKEQRDVATIEKDADCDGKNGGLGEDGIAVKDLGTGLENEAVQAMKEIGGDRQAATTDRISLSVFGTLSCIGRDVHDLKVCPPLHRMYDQLDEYYGDEARHKLGFRNEFLLKTPVKGQRQVVAKQSDVSRNLAGSLEEAREADSDGEEAHDDGAVAFEVDNANVDDDADGGGDDSLGDGDNVVEVETIADDENMENDTNVVDLAGRDDEDGGQLDDNTDESPHALDKESSLTSSAADFFRAKGSENMPENHENHLFSQMIESAMLRSAALEDEQSGDVEDGKNDYSYFDVKLLRNWAGPGHWKFPAVRKVQMKQRVKEEAEKDVLEVDEDAIAMNAELPVLSMDRGRKGSTAGVDKKASSLVDFFSEEPDLSRFKAPTVSSSLEIPTGTLKKQSANASDLVLPVDMHIELSLFFRHFLKEKSRFFRKRVGGVDGVHREGVKAEILECKADSGHPANDVDQDAPLTYNDDGGFEPDYDDEVESTIGAGPATLYSVEGLVQADRVVEKIGVHYERFAKRVDVKKLKGSIWDHLERRIGPSKKPHTDRSVGAEAPIASGKRPREFLRDDDGEECATNFASVVENVATKVPSNVTVSFYFICVLHLANEKGLELVGQDHLCNFQIRKE